MKILYNPNNVNSPFQHYSYHNCCFNTHPIIGTSFSYTCQCYCRIHLVIRTHLLDCFNYYCFLSFLHSLLNSFQNHSLRYFHHPFQLLRPNLYSNSLSCSLFSHNPYLLVDPLKMQELHLTSFNYFNYSNLDQ